MEGGGFQQGGGGFGGGGGGGGFNDNRRPGDWDCTSCGAVVFASKNACFRCHTPRDGGDGGNFQQGGGGYGGGGGYQGGGGYGGGGGGGGGDNRRPGDWDCPNCNALVFASKSNCFKCGTPKDGGGGDGGYNGGGDGGYNQGGGGGRGDVRPGDWTCPNCNAHVFASKFNCFRCQTPKPDGAGGNFQGGGGGYGGGGGGGGGGYNNVRPGDWTCPSCQANCFASKTECFRCNTPKPMGGDMQMDGGNFDGGNGSGSFANTGGYQEPQGQFAPQEGQW